MAKTGIDWITYYTPGLYLDIEELAEKRGIEPAKLKKGLDVHMIQKLRLTQHIFLVMEQLH